MTFIAVYSVFYFIVNLNMHNLQIKLHYMYFVGKNMVLWCLVFSVVSGNYWASNQEALLYRNIRVGLIVVFLLLIFIWLRSLQNAKYTSIKY